MHPGNAGEKQSGADVAVSRPGTLRVSQASNAGRRLCAVLVSPPSHQQSDCLSPLPGHRASSWAAARLRDSSFLLQLFVLTGVVSTSSGPGRRTRQEDRDPGMHRLPALAGSRWALSQVLNPSALPGECRNAEGPATGLFLLLPGTLQTHRRWKQAGHRPQLKIKTRVPLLNTTKRPVLL